MGRRCDISLQKPPMATNAITPYPRQVTNDEAFKILSEKDIARFWSKVDQR